MATWHKELVAKLVTQWSDRLGYTLVSFGLGRENCEDILQESFTRLIEELSRGRIRKMAGITSVEQLTPCIEGSLWKLLRTIAFRLALRFKAANRARGVRLDGTAPEPASDEESPEGSLLKDERSRILDEALKTLGDDQHHALVLFYFEDMSYADIGKVLDRSPKAVKSLISRAKTELRDRLTARGLQLIEGVLFDVSES